MKSTKCNACNRPFPQGPISVKIQDELDLAYEIYTESCTDKNIDLLEQHALEGTMQGLLRAIAIINGTTEDNEYVAAEERYAREQSGTWFPLSDRPDRR